MFQIIVILYLLTTNNIYPVEVQIFTKSHQWKISPYLVGLHFIYLKEPDNVYEDKQVALWTKRSSINIARFPGGTVIKGWDWRAPIGRGFKSDPWNPEGNYSVAPESNWMSLDEYLDFAKISGIKPLL